MSASDSLLVHEYNGARRDASPLTNPIRFPLIQHSVFQAIQLFGRRNAQAEQRRRPRGFGGFVEAHPQRLHRHKASHSVLFGAQAAQFSAYPAMTDEAGKFRRFGAPRQSETA